MARYRKIDTRIWNDAKFASLSSEGKLLFLYLLTTPAMTMLGAIPMRASAVAEELDMDSKQYAIRYQELYSRGIVEYDDRGLFWVKNFLKYNAPDNPKVVISWGNVVDLLPECPLLQKVLKSAEAHCLQRGERYAEAFQKIIGNGMPYGIRNGMPYQEQEQEQEQEQDIYRDINISVKKSAEDLFSEADEDIQIDKPSNGCPPCPVKKIVELYNEMLPELPKATSCNNKRASHIRARWKECYESGDFTTQEEGITAFKKFFEIVRSRPMLMKQKTMSNGEYINTTIDFIFNPQKFVNICEGGMYL